MHNYDYIKEFWKVVERTNVSVTSRLFLAHIRVLLDVIRGLEERLLPEVKGEEDERL